MDLLQTNPLEQIDFPRPLRILGVHPNMGGCAYYRCINPLTKLGQLYPQWADVRLDDNPLGFDLEKAKITGQPWSPDWPFENLKWADVVFINNISNYGGEYTAAVLGKAKEFGKFAHVDTDDLLTNLYEEHRLYGVYKERQLDEITKFLYNHADLVSVTQKKFMERIAPFCAKFLAIIPNCIDYELPGWKAPKVKTKFCKIGWAAGIHHAPDVKIFAGIPHLVNQKVGSENVRWDFYGHPPPPKPGEKKDWQHDVWVEYRNNLLASFKGKKNWDIHYALPTDQYGVMLANIDVSIAPLAMNLFNDSKSAIKVAECAAYKIPLVASNVGCYDEYIVNGETGYLIEPGAPKTKWVDYLSKLVKDRGLRERMGENMGRYKDMFDLNKVAIQRLILYKTIFHQIGFKPPSWGL